MIGVSAHNFIFFKAVFMVVLRPVSPENDHSNLKLNVLISICQTFLNFVSYIYIVNFDPLMTQLV